MDIGQLTLVVPLKEREIHNEKYIPVTPVDSAQLFAQVDPKPGQDGIGLVGHIGLEEEQAPRSSFASLGNRGAFFLGQELHDGRSPLPVLGNPDPAQTACSQLLADKGFKTIDLATGNSIRIVYGEALHDPPLVDYSLSLIHI